MDIIAPTQHRLAKGGQWETPHLDRKTKRTHHRLISIPESMRTKGWLGDEQLQAYQRFERDLTKAERVHLPMCQYGRPFLGTDDSPWSPLDLKLEAVARVREAVKAVAVPVEIRALSLAALTETTLEKIGREIGNHTNTGRAITQAKTLLQSGTYRLALHYQYIRGP